MSETWHELNAQIAAVDARLTARRARAGLQAWRLKRQVARRITSWEVLLLGATAGYIAGEVTKPKRRMRAPLAAPGAGRWERTLAIGREIFHSPLGKMLIPVAIQQVHALIARHSGERVHSGAPGAQDR